MEGEEQSNATAEGMETVVYASKYGKARVPSRGGGSEWTGRAEEVGRGWTD